MLLPEITSLLLFSSFSQYLYENIHRTRTSKSNLKHVANLECAENCLNVNMNFIAS